MSVGRGAIAAIGVAGLLMAARWWPGRVQAGISSKRAAPVAMVSSGSLADIQGDGIPDVMDLESRADTQAFRKWFTFLAEVQFFQDAARRPREIVDCAALIRYAYREALRGHDSRWAMAADLPVLLALPSVKKYSYPHTALGAALFRVKPGPFEETDLTDGSFSQFADAKTLRLRNTHFVSSQLDRAEPGDLLFFRHESAHMPFHGMIYLGRSQIKDDGQRYLVYHTGPSTEGRVEDPGEIRRPSVEELLAHPNPGWRPVSGNPTFLGVYRWNILQ